MKMKKVFKREMLTNRYGIKVKKCCASCANKEYDEQGLRCCQLTGKHVRGKAVCDNWSMNEGLKCLGCKHGKVQSRAYQLTLMEIRVSELNEIAKGKDVGLTPVESIRRDFELRNGSIYSLK